MNGTLEHKGYTGSVEYSAEDELLYGKVLGIRDKVIYDGRDVRTLKKHFRDAVDEYLAFCKAEKKVPEKPFKGSLNIRITSELHRSIAVKAEQEHKSINALIKETLQSVYQ